MANHSFELSKILEIEEEQRLSEALEITGIHHPMQFRFLWRSRKIAKHLISVHGDWGEQQAQHLLKVLEQEGCFTYPLSPREKEHFCHIKKVVSFIQEHKEAQLFLKRLTLPLAHPFVEKMIRWSLLYPKEKKIAAEDVRESVLAAVLNPLSQSVGSCFATAPLILLQLENPLAVLEDLYDLVTTGRIKRVIEGKEYKVPMSIKVGFGDIRKPLLHMDIAKLLPSLACAFQIAKIPFPTTSKIFPCSIEEFLFASALKDPSITKEDIEALQRQEVAPPNPFKVVSKKEVARGHLLQESQDSLEELKGLFKSYTEHPLLKVWEYTIASFSDFKEEFYKWNLFASIGFDHQEPGGLGELLHQLIGVRLEEENGKIREYEEELLAAQDQMRVVETLLRNAASEDKIRRLKAELMAKEHHFYSCRDMRDKAVKDAEYCSQFFNFFIDQFLFLFPQYFQELYDPEMYGSAYDVYEDMPAGFRVVYKHGRYDPSLWTAIETKEQYVNSLVDFVYMVEPQMITVCEWEKGKEAIPEINREIVQYFQGEVFIQNASARITKMHQEVMKGVKTHIPTRTPWAYTSGGSLPSLLKAYFGFQNDLVTEEITTSSIKDLGIFLVDLLKDSPQKMTQASSKRLNTGLLMTSPTHAFTLRPAAPGLKEAWEDRGNTHTWFRDQIFESQKSFYDRIVLSPKEQSFLVNVWSSGKKKASLYETLHISTFSEKMSSDLQQAYDGTWHHFVRKAFPLVAIDDALSLAKEAALSMEKNLRRKFTIDQHFLQEVLALKEERGGFLLFVEFFALLESIVLPQLAGAMQSYPLVKKALASLHQLPPDPFTFADTNWPMDYFAVLYTAASRRFDLWRIDLTGFIGEPMLSWRHLFEGKKGHTWTVYTNRLQYSRLSTMTPT